MSALRDPRVKACGFTGSTTGGRALFDITCSRPDPIPFFGELGSINPVVVTADAAARRASEIAAGYVASFTPRPVLHQARRAAGAGDVRARPYS